MSLSVFVASAFITGVVAGALFACWAHPRFREPTQDPPDERARRFFTDVEAFAVLMEAVHHAEAKGADVVTYARSRLSLDKLNSPRRKS